MSKSFVISHNVPLPPKHKPIARNYPFEAMAVGDSFLLNGDKPQTAGYLAAVFARRQNPPWQFTVRETKEGYRCWRIK